MDISPNKIHLTIKTLMQMKSKRDGENFTLYQLAKALNMAHSVLSRLIHEHSNKRVNNPSIDTLIKIVKFFQSDGFNVTFNDLLMGFEEDAVTIQEQKLDSFTTEVKLPLYSFGATHHTQNTKIGNIHIKLATTTKHAIALLSEEAIKPLFKKGSIFIIDTKANPENDNLVAVKITKNHQILIRKFHIEENKKLLTSYDNGTDPIILDSRIYSIVGVVIQVNAKT